MRSSPLSVLFEVETLGLADALKAADPDADLSSVTAEMSDPVAADPTPEPAADPLDSAAGVAALLLGAFVNRSAGRQSTGFYDAAIDNCSCYNVLLTRIV